ncbi:hypothetical protein KCP70_24335 [Salmonella enterica subsp. enterica]|nr:hypothetical protein KCP70_24335 [Salmonella enterica subsp. enterica]
MSSKGYFCKSWGLNISPLMVTTFRLWAAGQQKGFSGLRVKTRKCRRAVTAGLRWTSRGDARYGVWRAQRWHGGPRSGFPPKTDVNLVRHMWLIEQLRVAQHRVEGSRWGRSRGDAGTFTPGRHLPRRNSEAALSR